MYVWVEWESKMAEFAHTHTHTHRCDGMVLLWSLSVSFSFMGLVQGHLKASNHLSFSSLLYSGQSESRPEPRVMWLLVSVFSGLLFTQLYNILDTHANSPVCHLHIACGHTFFKQATHAIYAALPLGNNLHLVFFRKRVHFILCCPCNLCGISARASTSYAFLVMPPM